MRGSPLIRSIFILIVLLVAGFTFARLTSSGVFSAAHPKDFAIPVSSTSQGIEARFFLTFSAPVRHVSIASGTDVLSFDDGSVSGRLLINPENPLIFLKVDWEKRGKEHYFAKLVIEAEGRETFMHIFDGVGDFDDFVELPF